LLDILGNSKTEEFLQNYLILDMIRVEKSCLDMLSNRNFKLLTDILNFMIYGPERSLQENRSMVTKLFRRTKVSILSLDVLGDEIVH
jgi:hypothetical protein